MPLLSLENLPLTERLSHRLRKILDNEAFGSPFIIEGSDRTFALKVAQTFAQEILLRYSSETTNIKLEKQTHPDFLSFYPEGTRSMHSITELKRLIDDAILPPFEGKYKIYLIADGEAMLPVHANALLKTLEEKHDHTIILLTTTSSSHLLPTIVSRCHLISLDELASSEQAMTPTRQCIIELLNLAHQGHLHQALKLSRQLEKALDQGGIAALEECIDTLDHFYKEKLYTGSSPLSFTDLQDFTSKLHLAYHRHVKLRNLAEYVAIYPMLAMQKAISKL